MGGIVCSNNYYRHYKGGRYYVICTAINTETGEPLVIYRSDDPFKKEQIHARPYAMFTELVEVNGEYVPRFELETGVNHV